ncbi:hypothetical protein [Bradyrhizobium sp. 141]|uniref:hypothetical protein n=1 Tax=Bradyrhizobium sp. 141 TaxID=2782617 RepID=UPI001FF963A3|nr:hypothetical protein [Bradyrhizobium sp. 141]MCK1718857.1 hypothetical protein [Bradyrhizobium sp. 141]
MDWSTVGQLVGQAAPTIGGILGGLIPVPGGAILGQVAGKVLAEALGVPPTPTAVASAIQSGDPAVIQAKLSEAEAKMQAEVETFKASVADVQDARRTSLEYDKQGSSIRWAASIVSVIAVSGFCIFSYIVIVRPSGADRDILMYLLGVWSAAFTSVLNYWLGSSAGSANKDDKLAAIAAAAPAKPPTVVRR